MLTFHISLQDESDRGMESIFVLKNARSNAISNPEKAPLSDIGGTTEEVFEDKYC